MLTQIRVLSLSSVDIIMMIQGNASFFFRSRHRIEDIDIALIAVFKQDRFHDISTSLSYPSLSERHTLENISAVLGGGV